MRIAALYDIHGNRFALDAVLAELEAVRPDVILIGGDIVAGPFPVQVLERLTALPNVRFIRGNTEREVVHLGPSMPATWAERVPWVHDQLAPGQLEFLANLPEQMILDAAGLGPTLFCHGSPRSDEEIITVLTA
jgi:predicted phosphodiesterase